MVKLPDRWLDYSPCGNVIVGTRLICFKTPLKKNFFYSQSEDVVWTVDDLLKRVPNLGLVIDLTFSRKYYEPEDLMERNVQYTKIYCEGHVVPKTSVVNEFNHIIDDFYEDSWNRNRLVGVHCTHGVNRTGYLVCQYLMRREHIDSKRAIQVFQEARGHPLERQNYLNALNEHDRTLSCQNHKDY